MTGYSLELIASQTMELLGSTKSKITKDQHNIFYCEINIF